MTLARRPGRRWATRRRGWGARVGRAGGRCGWADLQARPGTIASCGDKECNVAFLFNESLLARTMRILRWISAAAVISQIRRSYLADPGRDQRARITAVSGLAAIAC